LIPKLLRSPEDIAAALAELQDARDISCETVDAIAGWESGYCGKLRVGIRKPGSMSLPAWLGSLGVALVLVEDTAAGERMRHRWVKRKRAPTTKPPSGRSE
jgi:hypothetical protein